MMYLFCAHGVFPGRSLHALAKQGGPLAYLGAGCGSPQDFLVTFRKILRDAMAGNVCFPMAQSREQMGTLLKQWVFKLLPSGLESMPTECLPGFCCSFMCVFDFLAE